MNMQTNTEMPLVASVGRESAVSVSETFWGYIVRKGGSAPRRAAVGEIIAMISTILFGFAAYSQWLLPNTIYDIEIFPYKIVGTILFFVLAFMNYSIARYGLLYETQVDEKRQEIRLARRNRDGVSTPTHYFQFKDVNRIYMVRSKSTFEPDRLLIEVGPKGKAIQVAMGNPGQLEKLRVRMTAEMRPRTIQPRRPAVIPSGTRRKNAIRGAFAAQ